MPTIAHILADPARLAVLRATGLIGTTDAPASLDRLTRLAALTVGVRAAFLTLVDDRCQHVVSHVGLEDVAGFPRIPLSHSFCQHVVHARDVVVVTDARDDPRVCDSPALEELGVRSYAGVPLELDGQVLGAFGVADTSPRHWTERQVEVLTHLAAAAAADVAAHARHADELVGQALDSSVLRHLPGTAVLRFDPDLRITLIDGSAVRERGWRPASLIGRRLDDVLPAEAFARLRPVYEAVLAGHQEPFDYTSLAGEVWHCQGAVIAGADGRRIGGTMVMRDVTQERLRERLLAERESQYRLLAERSTDVISRHDASGRYTYLSPASAAVFGYGPDDLLGRDPYDLIHPDDVDAVRARHARLLGRLEAAGSTYRLVRADGRVIWVESIARAVRDGDDRVVELQCATRDVTARHDAEEARRRSEQLTSTIVEALEEGLVVHASDGSLLACNASAERILGLDRDVLAGRDELPPGWQVRDEHGRLLPVDDRPAAVALRTGRPQVGRIMAVDHPDGRRTWIRANGVPLMDAEGRAHRVLVSFADITELREAEHDARHRADHDPLTGLPNRTRLRRCLEQSLADSRAADGDAAVLFLDLDRFKVINDSLGHGAGDTLLVAAADRLRSELRGADVLARFGGDEFVVVAAVDGEAGATALAERLIGVLRAPFVLEGAEHVVRASVGIALAAGGRAEAEELLRSADLAMYRAKEEGRGGYAVFDDGMLERAVERLSLERQLRQALARDELELHFQPIWTVRGHALAGVEALVRWRHPERGLVPPGHFIPVAEHSGLIVEIGDWVLEEACRQLAEWRRHAPSPPPPVNVNVSVRQLDDPHFPARVAAVLDAHRLPPEALALEVTESLLMSRPDQAQAGLEALRDLGVRLVLDDFGTGHSSLSRLSRLPLHTLKVDRSFVAALPRDPADHAIVQAIFSMASTLGLRVVAEGVETEEQLGMLRRLGCDMAQGYLLGRPAPAAEIALLLARAHRPEPAH